MFNSKMGNSPANTPQAKPRAIASDFPCIRTKPQEQYCKRCRQLHIEPLSLRRQEGFNFALKDKCCGQLGG